MSRLENKVAIITGGAGGIGLAAARRFTAEGASVLLVDRDAAALASAEREIAAGDQLVTCVADVTVAKDSAHYVEQAVQNFGGVDILLANAGIEGQIATFEDYDEAVFDQVLAVNVKGVWLGLKMVMPAMRTRGAGSIVITSSTAGIKGSANLSAYVASKHAVIGLMRSAAMYGAADNIRVNTVNPAPVETRMMRSIESGISSNDIEEVHARIANSVPLGRYAEPDEIANVMLFLASDEASYVTGGVYMADGGTSAS